MSLDYVEVRSVTSLVSEVKRLLEGQYRNINVEGEVTNLTRSSSAHYYFTLSDKNSSVAAALFKMDAYRNPLIRQLKNGDKVIINGRIGVYLKRGTFQIVVKSFALAGKGDLQEQFETLKKKLAEKGLFDLEKKKKIPNYPQNIAIITAERGAALQDFINICARRSIWMNIYIFPSLVQGEEAPRSIIDQLKSVMDFNLKKRSLDVVVLARGGGSLEDLWAFNDEGLAHAIYNFSLPVVSAIGHQVDYLISDFVSDLRAETPSAAAEMLTAGQVQLKERLRRIGFFLFNQLDLLFTKYHLRLSKLDISKRAFELIGSHEKEFLLDDLFRRMTGRVKQATEQKGHHLKMLGELLKAFDPRSVLERGYSYVEEPKGEVVASVKDYQKLEKDSTISIHFKDGRAGAKVWHQK